jgi:proteasome activator subunit 4
VDFPSDISKSTDRLQFRCQTDRTLAVIKALGAVAPAIVSRQVYYPGAKYLVPVLELLIPGIDLVSHFLDSLTD